MADAGVTGVGTPRVRSAHAACPAGCLALAWLAREGGNIFVSAEPVELRPVMGSNAAALRLSIWRSSRCGAGFPLQLRSAPLDLFPRRLPVFVWPMWTGVAAARQYRQPSELSQKS